MDTTTLFSDQNIQKVWERFFELTKIPRKSKQEEKVVQYLVELAKTKNWPFKTDSVNNVLVEIPATLGLESQKGVLLQGHSDMVCVADEGFNNPADFGVLPKQTDDKKWITASGTTLGADNGIGVAVFLALLEDNTYKHGPLALLVTTDEETGLNGAKNLQFDLSAYTYLVNGDSEDWGEAIIGCAGGEDTIITLDSPKEKSNSTHAYSLTVKGLQGGHSALAIAEPGRVNAIKLLAAIVSDVELGIQLFAIHGGTARNVIPNSAELVFAVNDSGINPEELLSQTIDNYKDELRNEPNAIIKCEPVEVPAHVFSIDATTHILSLIDEIPHGVFIWADSLKTKPQTSTNMATIQTNENSVTITSMSRSSIEKELDEMSNQIKNKANLYSANVKTEGRYPAWEPISDSFIVKIAKDIFSNTYGEELDITQTHGGLECGIIRSRYPHMEAISMGPTIKGAHSTSEKVEIESVEKFYKFIRLLIEKLAQS